MKKRVSEIIFIFISLPVFLISCASGPSADSVKSQLEVNAPNKIAHNHFNKLGLQTADTTLAELYIKTFKEYSPQQLLQELQHDGSFSRTSYLIYTLGHSLLKKDTADFNRTMTYLHSAADDYLNPLAMLDLSRIYFRPHDDVQKLFPTQSIVHEKNYPLSFYYVSASLQLASMHADSTGDQYLLNTIIGAGMSLIEAFESGEVRKEFNADSATVSLQSHLDSLARVYSKLYFH